MSQVSATPSVATPVSRFIRKPIVSPEQRAAVDVTRLPLLLLQMAALAFVIAAFKIERERFFVLICCVFSGFLLHYFTPFRFKKVAFLAISLLGAFITLGYPEGATTLNISHFVGPSVILGIALFVGLIFFGLLRLPIPFAARVGLVLLVAGGLAVLRARGFGIPPIWNILGALFMFRLIIYAYDVKTARKPEKFIDYMNYFFLLPNFYFVLFPVIDYTTFKKSYYADDIHVTAQRGLAWIARGVIHLALYRIIYHDVLITSDAVDSMPTLLLFLFQTFWLYLNVSGQFHIAIGMLHLFGYKLPETNHLYFLASSFTDFWRRINIYWKDFMVKVVYYPVYFRFRKMNETAALIVATLTVFVATTVLHSYQMFWIQNGFEIGWNDIVFWGVLGVLVLINVVWESKRKPAQAKEQSRGAKFIKSALSTLAVYITISILWSIWYSTSPVDWYYTVTYWR